MASEAKISRARLSRIITEYLGSRCSRESCSECVKRVSSYKRWFVTTDDRKIIALVPTTKENLNAYGEGYSLVCANDLEYIISCGTVAQKRHCDYADVVALFTIVEDESEEDFGFLERGK